MTNEELVVLIQAGQPELAAALWQQVERLVGWKANRVAAALPPGAGVTKEDLVNTGYIAMVEAVETFDSGAGATFSSWLMIHLQRHFAEAGGYRNQSAKNEPCRNAISLDTFVGDGEKSTISDLVPDPKAAATMEGVEDSLWVEQLHRAELEVLSAIKQDQAEAVYRNFILGQTCEECAVSMGISHIRAKGLIQMGMDNLRKPKNSCRLRPFLHFDYFHGTGLSSFRNSGMSIQEQYLISLERAEERAVRREKRYRSKDKKNQNARHEADVGFTEEEAMENEKKIALSEYQEAKKELICWTARVAELETSCSQCSTVVSGETVHIMDMAAVELEIVREKQTAATIRAREAMRRVVDLIQQAPTAGQRKVLLLRYIDGLGWADIGEREGKTRTWATNLHATALQHITLPTRDEGST